MAFHMKLCGHSAFPEDFHTRKLGEITVCFSGSYEKITYKENLKDPWENILVPNFHSKRINTYIRVNVNINYFLKRLDHICLRRS